MIDNIPDELKRLNQFCVWRYINNGSLKPTKVPYHAVTGNMASVTDPSSWVDFETAKANAHNYSGIGFVFTPSDPYCVIDLDDTEILPSGLHNPNAAVDFKRQQEIFKHFNSYAEFSPSGRGLHLIFKASIPSGKRKDYVEMYSSHRYITMTGNVFKNSPIENRQELADMLYKQMSSEPKIINFHGNATAVYEDDAVLTQAADASNGEKFKDLWHGNWQQYYQSQSEADFAFIDIVAFYSKNKEQIIRLFHRSALGQRDKAKRADYVNWMVSKSFDKMLPPVDIDGFRNAIEEKIARQQAENAALKALRSPYYRGDASSANAPLQPIHKRGYEITCPPGLVGEIAKFIYNNAPLPVPEIAIAGALGLMAGICGRAYNVSGTGLNQYILLLAATGRGKEAMASGINRLMNEVHSQCPAADEFLGPGELASGQALLKYLSKKAHCFVSVIGEFGLRMQRVSGKFATPTETMLRSLMLDLYHKSGFGNSHKGTVYSDFEKNVSKIMSPALTILGESNPYTLYDNLTEEMIREGLLPRFTIIHYDGPSVENNDNHANAAPSPLLIASVTNVASQALQNAKNNVVLNVRFTEEADRALKKFRAICKAKLNEDDAKVTNELWNRAHLKSLKIAATIAVGVDFLDPIITLDLAEWAINLTNYEVSEMVSKFDTGQIGVNNQELQQIEKLEQIIIHYVTADYTKISGYTKLQNMHNDKVVPYEYIQKKLVSDVKFKTDRAGSSNAIKRAIQLMIDREDIVEIPKSDVKIKYGSRQRAYTVNDKLLK